MNKVSQASIGIGAAGVAFFVGFWTLGGSGGLKVLLLSSVVATPTVVMLTGQNRERTEQLESQLSKANCKLESANQERSRLAISNSGLSSNLESAAQSLSETRQALREASQERDEAIQVVSDLQAAIAALNRKLESYESEVEDLRAEVGAWEAEFDSRVNTETDKRFQIAKTEEIERVFSEHDAIQWADMEQMVCFYQGSSALDAIKNNPALELKRDVLIKQYKEISTVIQGKNEWLDDAKKHYFGLCVIPGKSPQWYELPVADEIEVEPGIGTILESFSVSVSNYGFVDRQNYDKHAPEPSPCDSLTANNGKAVTQSWWDLHCNGDPDGDATIVRGNAQGDTGVKPSCKKHPAVRLTQGKDGRYYCSGCKKKLRKNQINWY